MNGGASMTLSSASSSSALGKRGLEHGGASPSAASVGHLSPARSSHAGTPPWGENGIPQAQQLQVDSGARPAKRPRAEDGGSPALRPSPLSASSLPEPLQSHSEEMRTSVERERSPAGAKERGASLPPSPSASQKMDYSQPDPAGTLQPAISSNYHGIPRHPPSMFDSEPFDDVVRVISLFLRPFIGRPNLEIEAKLGVLVDKNTNNRLFLGIDTEAVIRDMGQSRFEPDMSPHQHSFFNQLLNARVQAGNPPVSYQHRYETDEFYDSPGGKLRVTKDTKTQQILGAIQKQRLANLDIHIPESHMDYRISVTIEHPVPVPYGKYPMSSRRKDRLSYKYDLFSIDLTQVYTVYANGESPPSHELEIEFLDPNAAFQGDLDAWNRGDKAGERGFMEKVKLMLNNVRYLARKMPRG